MTQAQERAKELMTLAMGVGISREQSELLMANKLEEYKEADLAEFMEYGKYHDNDGPEYENRL